MLNKDDYNRIVVWFSCGVTSAIAAKIAIKKYKGILPISIIYTDPGFEHTDNKRFLKDCEKWFDIPITILKSKKYSDIYDVFKKTKYLVGPRGARCTTEMKKVLRHDFQKVATDIQVFGFDSSETKRAERFSSNNPEVNLWTPLIENKLSKTNCLSLLKTAKIEIPAMYKLGYKNNNCIGCVKGQGGYWNKIRIDFPEIFEKMSLVEQELNIAICKTYAGDGKRKKLFLKDLPPDFGRYEIEPSIECGVLCLGII